jgi:putative oxidoreductase
MSFSEQISPFLGRCALVWYFLTVAGDILDNFHGLGIQLADKHMPLPPLVLVVALVLIVLGCISLLFGYHARHGAVLLFGLSTVAAVTLHDYWHVTPEGGRGALFALFTRDIAIAGGLLVIVGLGAGPFALDNRSKGGKKR